MFFEGIVGILDSDKFAVRLREMTGEGVTSQLSGRINLPGDKLWLCKGGGKFIAELRRGNYEVRHWEEAPYIII